MLYFFNIKTGHKYRIVTLKKLTADEKSKMQMEAKELYRRDMVATQDFISEEKEEGYLFTFSFNTVIIFSPLSSFIRYFWFETITIFSEINVISSKESFL